MGGLPRRKTGKDGRGDEISAISVMPVGAHSSARLTRWPELDPLLHTFWFAASMIVQVRPSRLFISHAFPLSSYVPPPSTGGASSLLMQ